MMMVLVVSVINESEDESKDESIEHSLQIV